MVVVRLLERKEIIRLFGAALFLSPILNTFASMAIRPDSPTKWTIQTFWKLVSSGTPFDHFLYIAGLIIGLLMLGGSVKTWRFVLVLLGGHIFRQIFSLPENVRTHWVYGLFFLINVSVFLFILDQLVWKQKSKKSESEGDTRIPAASTDALAPLPAAPIAASAESLQTALESPIAVPPPVMETPMPTPGEKPVSVQETAPSKPKIVADDGDAPQLPPPKVYPARKKIMIHFEGVGPWAYLTGLTHQGLWVKAIATPPKDLSTRHIEIAMQSGLRLRARVAHQTQDEYFFEYIYLSPSEILMLNDWLKSQAA